MPAHVERVRRGLLARESSKAGLGVERLLLVHDQVRALPVTHQPSLGEAKLSAGTLVTPRKLEYPGSARRFAYCSCETSVLAVDPSGALKATLSSADCSEPS